MAIAGLTIYVLVSGVIMLIAAFTFDGILLRQFIKKRTMGTLLLLITYLLFTFGEMTTIAGNYVFVFFPALEVNFAHFQLLYSGLYGLGFVFMYFFANRHILKDSDATKATISIFISFFVGIASALMTAEILWSDTNLFYNKTYLVGFEMPQYLPSTLAGILLIVPILIFIQIRIIIRILRIRRGLDNKISKMGFTFILLSVVSLVLATLSSSFFIYEFVTSSPIYNTLFHTLRIIFNTLGFLFGYFGWIMPDWLKKQIRGKAWIVKTMNKKKTDITSIQPIASSNLPQTNQISIIELAEQ
ncbi:MAG: hypothetical protein EAX90_14230 [Candidatus Heimdallarchaeota archaeon]|nr:hypothetical protein [Candidatus Heimdallarchaeota archaeon]